MARGADAFARRVAAAAAAAKQQHAWRVPLFERALGGGGNVVSAAALVALAARVEFPIGSVPTVAMVLLGVLALVAAPLACCSAGRKGGSGGGRACRCAGATFVALQLIGVALQALLTLLLFARLDGAVQMVVASSSSTSSSSDAAAASAAPATAATAAADAAAEAARGLVTARWILLCLLIPLQSAALALGVTTSCCGLGSGDDDDGGGGGLGAGDADRQASLAALRGDVERGGGGGGGGVASSLSAAALGVGAMYERTRGALVAKYGRALVAKPAALLTFWRR